MTEILADADMVLILVGSKKFANVHLTVITNMYVIQVVMMIKQ